MDVEQTLALYDEEQRRTVEYPTMRRDPTEHVVRQIDLTGKDSVVIYSMLNIENADAVIRDQISFFEGLGHNFEWKYYQHDSPPDLKARLANTGFQIGEIENIVALDLSEIPEILMRPVTHDLRRIKDPNQIAEVMFVQNEVWPKDEDSLVRRQILFEMQNAPGSISVYVAYLNDQPVGSAWIRFKETSCFASLWAGATLPAQRRRGIYTALLAIRAQEAIERGTRFLTVDAGPMSLPILKRLGFQLLTLSNPCEWRLKRST